ncbi:MULTISPECIES: DAK2 domain-containing protein [Exiguobacterium]|uniref:DAK2 domain-containing protein n=1 Tax=Exiguobacterium TaxID=33986 RepID=UPI0012EF14B6|nr:MULTISPECIES: DAK2 domain-containing protein [Exiguobacterium]MDT0191245.1 DAK2 domain-containing protein [Exiguobacterium sp. BG5(2022)]VXB06343.1 putative enzyme structurally related to dihydroxyacetone/glyceraldehyde kinase [Exiguobacterium sp. 8H]VXB06529.1 putative enzyme structurally related to dihydroxyacetone/glyceraldehyde kinase [Exiguobacterium sp. 8A]
MGLNRLDGVALSNMIANGAANLSQNADYVDSLNVFPVPDGDTGTNMNLTMTSGAKEVAAMNSSDIAEVSSKFARGLLMGARGNSGVILSQLFRGFGKAVEGKTELTTVDFAEALKRGVDTAYKAVMKPVEGTILTVAREAADEALLASESTSDFTEFMKRVIVEAKASLDRTPDLLPVLKEVGVVDSGGQGLLVIYEGFLASLEGKELEKPHTPVMDALIEAEHHAHAAQGFMSTEDIEFGYCTEIMVRFQEDKLKDAPFNEDAFRNELSELGDSLLVVADEELLKVHVHVETPGEVITKGQRFGELVAVKIENMRQQHSTILEEEHGANQHGVQQAEKPKAPFAIVTVAMGEGVSELFRSLGAAHVIEGGQTMNPSTEDIVKAIESAHAEHVFIFPNNSNIIMAAEQAASVAPCGVSVIPTKTVPQGLAAAIAFNPEADVEMNEQAMKAAAATVKSGQVTYAVRDTSIDGVEIKKDEHMAIAEKKIVSSSPSSLEAAKRLVDALIDADDEIVTILTGEGSSASDVEALTSYIESVNDEIEIEVHDGKQPLYSYIFSVE